MDLSEKVAIVTGAGKGLGWAIAERLARDGAKLVIAEIDWPSAREKAAAIRKMEGEALPVKMDVSLWADAKRMAGQAMDKFGRIDILVNNAGILGPYSLVEEYPEELWDRVIAVHLKGTFLCCKAVLPVMRRQGTGSIVNIASVAGKEGNPNACAYSSSKAAVIGLTKTLGNELATKGVIVNCVAPAAVQTQLFGEFTQSHIDFMLSKIPMGRFGLVDEIAATVVWACTEECSFTTGATFDLSGGRATY